MPYEEHNETKRLIKNLINNSKVSLSAYSLYLVLEDVAIARFLSFFFEKIWYNASEGKTMVTSKKL